MPIKSYAFFSATTIHSGNGAKGGGLRAIYQKVRPVLPVRLLFKHFRARRESGKNAPKPYPA
jgi:hypothetical protein